MTNRELRMSPEDRDRMFKIRCASKEGRYVSPDDRAFCRKMYEKHPAQYAAMEKEVFDATKPFGVQDEQS